MCGIAGLFCVDGSRSVEQPTIRAMNRRLAHRGPDHDGVHVEESLGIGCRRLAIIDLPSGNQPLTNDDESLWIVYNGEIYNQTELRKRLSSAAGVSGWRTRSDTELALVAYERFGPECCELLHGMFAFAVWDRRRRSLFLARDRLGIKPLYWTWQPPWFAFASECKALLLPPLAPAAPNVPAVVEALLCGYPHGEETLFRNIQALPPGHTLHVTAEGPVMRRYWDVPFTPPEPAPDEPAALARTAALLEDSVVRELVADVPVGCYLSGGLDSSVVTTLASRHQPDLPTFTIGYGTNSELFRRHPHRIVGEVIGDDLHFAALAAEALPVRPHILPLDTGSLVEDIDRMLWHREKPLVTLAEYGHFRVNRAASRHVKVMLSGQGSDELFGGYYYWWQRRDLRTLRTFPLLWLSERPAGAAPATTPEILDSLLRDEVRREASCTERIEAKFADALARADTPDDFNRFSYLFVKFHLHEMLELEDRHGMAASVESRVPFLDHRLVTHVLNLPGALKASNTEKVFLKKLVQAHIPELPEAIRQRKKSPMPPPFAVEDLVQAMVSALRSPRLAVADYLRPERLQAFLDTMTAAARGPVGQHHYALFRLYFLERWHRLFVEGC